MSTLRDPLTGDAQRIDVSGRAAVYANTETTGEHFAHIGDGYNIHTGWITLTNATETPILYVKNNDAGGRDLVITGIFYFMGTSNSPGDSYWDVVRNPTTGTIISSTPTTVPVASNRGHASPNTLTVDAYIGATGDTMTDGTDELLSLYTGTGRNAVIVGAIVLAKGNSIGIKYTPPTSNTSQVVGVALACFLESTEPSFR